MIRFAQNGRRGERKYKVVVSEKRERREGRPVEVLGFYEKRVGNTVEKQIDTKRVEYWVSKGAQLSPSVKRVLEGK
ncbi:MAG: 30S ribosomal protein S16 [Candidatus Levyibacteriota bacterium]